MSRIIFLSVFFLFSCAAETDLATVDGAILFGGPGIHLYDLSTKEKKTLVSSSERLVRSIAKVEEDKFLVSLLDLKPAERREKIEIWSLNGIHRIPFSYGANAVFLKKYGIVAYGNIKGDLVIASLSDSDNDEILIEENNKFQAKPVIVTGDNTFIFIKEIKNEYNVAEYDLINKATTVLPAYKRCSLDKSVWLSERSSLLCQEREKDGYLTGKYFAIS